MSSRQLKRGRGSFTTTQDHWWWREGWGPGTRYLTWHVTFEDAADLHQISRHVGTKLANIPNVDVVPVEWLHLTMTGVGFAGEYDDDTVRLLADAGLGAVKGLNITPLVFDRLNLYSASLCLSTSSSWLQELKGRQHDVLAKCGAGATRDEAFMPHVSLAYFSGAVDEDLLDEALDAARLEPVAVRAPRVSLIEIGRDDRVYTWRLLAQTTLRG